MENRDLLISLSLAIDYNVFQSVIRTPETKYKMKKMKKKNNNNVKHVKTVTKSIET